MKVLIKILKVLAVCIVAGLIVIQFFGIDRTNTPVVEADSLESAVTVPENVQAILNRSCADCHSNKTVYPWYASLQPFGWFLQNHISGGRREMNFSQFNTYPARKKIKRLESTCELAQKREMPLPSYLWIHRDSVLTDADIKTLCDWADSEKTKITE